MGYKNNRKKRLPNFLVIGAGRCGTTSLCDTLASHPDVFMCDPKEPGFFSNDALYQRGIEWYMKLFDNAGDKIALGEGTVNNSKRHLSPHAAERIALHLPDAKLIYIVRHPLEQILSNWKYAATVGDESQPFAEAIIKDADYLATCHYEWQLEAFHSAFGRSDNILVLFMEDMKNNYKRVANRAFTFLGLDNQLWEPCPIRFNAIESVKRTHPVVNQLRNLSYYAQLRQYIPKSLRKTCNKLATFRGQVDVEAEWDFGILSPLLPLIQERAERFLLTHDRPPDYWDFSPFFEKGNRAGY
jgi:hypothetical protein